MSRQFPARILIIEDEQRIIQELQEMFEPLGYTVQIAQGYGQALINDALTLARRYRPHVAIIDLRLDDTDKPKGIRLLKGLFSARCIIYSAYINAEISRSAEEYGATVIDKDEKPQAVIDLVKRGAHQKSASVRGLVVSPTSLSERIIPTLGLAKDIPSAISSDILAQLFPQSSKITLDTMDGSVRTPDAVSRGHSVVLKVWQDDRPEPLVVKFAPRGNVREEHKNYEDFIDRNLSGRFNAMLQGKPAIFWDVGAVLYTFLSAPMQTLSVFREYYMEHDAQSILKPINHLFTEVWGKLYERGEVIDGSLFSSYNRCWRLRLEERLLKYSNQDRNFSFPELQISLLNPISWVLRHKDRSLFPLARKAITHGDLHGDNIFVDSDHAWVIDFERSGWGHILRDFVELEVDIVSRLIPHDVDLPQLFALFVALTELRMPVDRYHVLANQYLANEQSKKAFDIVSGLREIAVNITGFTDYHEYYWGLLLDALFVATLTTADTQRSSPSLEKSQRERALLYAAVICGRLESWNGKWPPANWRKILEKNKKNKNDNSAVPEVHIV